MKGRGITSGPMGLSFAQADARYLRESSGVWSPVDISGAGLVFTFAGTPLWRRAGRLVTITTNVIFPATANGLAVRIGGLPFTPDPNNCNSQWGATNMAAAAGVTQPIFPFLDATVPRLELYRINGGAPAFVTNVDASGGFFRFNLSYLTAP